MYLCKIYIHICLRGQNVCGLALIPFSDNLVEEAAGGKSGLKEISEEGFRESEVGLVISLCGLCAINIILFGRLKC